MENLSTAAPPTEEDCDKRVLTVGLGIGIPFGILIILNIICFCRVRKKFRESVSVRMRRLSTRFFHEKKRKVSSPSSEMGNGSAAYSTNSATRGQQSGPETQAQVNAGYHEDFPSPAPPLPHDAPAKPTYVNIPRTSESHPDNQPSGEEPAYVDMTASQKRKTGKKNVGFGEKTDYEYVDVQFDTAKKKPKPLTRKKKKAAQEKQAGEAAEGDNSISSLGGSTEKMPPGDAADQSDNDSDDYLRVEMDSDVFLPPD